MPAETPQDAAARAARMFPLQAHGTSGPHQIPWYIASIAYGAYVKQFGSNQSLERIAERAGFSWIEMDEYYPGWRVEFIAWGRGERSLRLAALAAGMHVRQCYCHDPCASVGNATGVLPTICGSGFPDCIDPCCQAERDRLRKKFEEA